VDDQLVTLRDLPLFSGVGDDVLQRVLEIAEVRELPAGAVLMRASQHGSSVFVILEGSVGVDDPGHEPIELGPGEFVGELALLVPDAVRSAWVRARTDVRCLVLDGGDFQRLLEEEPRIALTMLPVVARRLYRSRRALPGD
jgi:CRP/FNR family cyclic AMP-dependent transcriptional regulator